MGGRAGRGVAVGCVIKEKKRPGGGKYPLLGGMGSTGEESWYSRISFYAKFRGIAAMLN